MQLRIQLYKDIYFVANIALIFHIDRFNCHWIHLDLTITGRTEAIFVGGDERCV